MLFLCSERDVFANFGKHLRGDAEERGEVICTNGKVQAQMNGKQMELHKNQVTIIPQNVTVADVMVSPDFNLKAMFFTNRILQSFLREKMSIWNDMMYIRRHHIVTMDEDEILMAP